MNLWERWIRWAVLIPVGMPAPFFVCKALDALIVVKRKLWAGVLLFLGCWVVSFNVIFIGDWVNLPFGMALMLICVWLCCEGSGSKRITLGLIFASTIMAFGGFYDNGVDVFISYYPGSLIHDLLYMLGRVVFALVLYLEVRFQKPEREFELSPPLWRLMLLLAVSSLGIEAALIFFRSPFMDRGTVFADAVLFLVVIFSFRGLLKALKVLERQQRLERENTLALMNRRYYEDLEQQQFEVRRLRHDMANHLQVLLTLPEHEKDSYIEEMLDNPAFVKSLSYCGDPTVNAVLAVKEGMMRQRGIRFLVKADIAGELPFDKADLCALFANGLDNGAEGCQDLAEPLREVSLEAKADKGVLAVEIRNPVPEEGDKNAVSGADAERDRTKLPATTKKDTQNHGFGLRSIRETVKKYGGNMEIRQQEGAFVLFFYLLFPEDGCRT